MNKKAVMGNQPHIGWICLIAVALSFSIFSACNEDAGTGVNGTNTFFGPPSVNDIPPLTNQQMLNVSGTRTPNTTIMVVNSNNLGEQEAAKVADPIAIQFWDGPVSLEEGSNKLTFHAVSLAGERSIDSPTFTVVLDTIPPARPSVKDGLPICTQDSSYTLEGSVEEGAKLLVDDEEVEMDGRNFAVTVDVRSEGKTIILVAVDAAGNKSEPVEAFIGSGLPIPTLNELPEVVEELVITISGEKEPGLGVILRKDGEAEGEFIVNPDGESTWSFDLDLVRGENTFFITGRTIEGEDSCDERGPITIIQSSVCPPIITNADELPAFTQEFEHDVEIERCADVDTVVAINDQPTGEALLVQDASAGLNITHNIVLQEGANEIRYYNRDADGLISPPATLSITVDTIPPNAPVYNPEPPPNTVEAILELRGDKDSNTSLCVRVEPDNSCTEQVPVNSSRSFSFDQELNLGPNGNNVCISSFDRAANQSLETCAFIERLPNDRPTIIIQTPVNGAPINTNPFIVEAIITDDNGLVEVEICFDGRSDCQDVAIHEEFDLYERQISPSGLQNGNSYTVTVNATNRGGVQGSVSVSVLFAVEGILLSNSEPEQLSERARLAIDGEGRVHAVWSDFCSQDACAEAPSSLPADIFHRIYNGAEWSPITLLSDDSNDSESESPGLATDRDGNVHVIWADSGNIDGSGFDFDIVHRVFDVNTDAWSEITVITADSNLQDRAPSIATGGDGSIHAVWERSGNAAFRIFHSRDTGGFWSVPRLASGDAGSDRAGNPQVAVDSEGTAFIVWQDDGDILGSGTDTDIYVKTFDGNFSATTVVSDANLDGLSVGPRVAISDDDILHITWEDNSTIFGSGNDFDIFYRSFSIAEGLIGLYNLVSRGEEDGSSSEPSIAVSPLDSGSVFVTWVDDGACPDCGPDFDVFYSRSFGGIFGGSPILVSAGDFSQTSEFPDIVFDDFGKVLHVVWEDDSTISRDGVDRDIFYLGIQLDE